MKDLRRADIRKVFATMGVAEHDVMAFDGPFPGLCAPLSLRPAVFDRPAAAYFDVFLPTRLVTIKELGGELNRATYLYRTGMVGFTPPGSGWIAEWDGMLEGIGFTFTRPVVHAAAMPDFADNAEELSWRMALADNAPAIAYLGLDIASQIAEDYPVGRAHTHELIRTFLALICRRYSSTPSRSSATVGALSRQVLKAIRYVDKHYDGDLSVDRLCDACGASPPHMNRLFRAELGKSVWQYIVDKRLEKARYLLEAEAGNIGEIAKQVGFASASSFSRSFTKKFGVSPSSYGCTPLID